MRTCSTDPDDTTRFSSASKLCEELSQHPRPPFSLLHWPFFAADALSFCSRAGTWSFCGSWCWDCARFKDCIEMSGGRGGIFNWNLSFILLGCVHNCHVVSYDEGITMLCCSVPLWSLKHQKSLKGSDLYLCEFRETFYHNRNIKHFKKSCFLCN